MSDVHVTTRPGQQKHEHLIIKNKKINTKQPARQSSETAISNATTTPARGRGSTLKNLKPLPSPDSTTPSKGRGSALKALKLLPSPDSEVKRSSRGPGQPSSGPKPMRIEYEKPGRPKLQPDPGAKK